jgi:choice-of-anchor B domain-containing protein
MRSIASVMFATGGAGTFGQMHKGDRRNGGEASPSTTSEGEEPMRHRVRSRLPIFSFVIVLTLLLGLLPAGAFRLGYSDHKSLPDLFAPAGALEAGAPPMPTEKIGYRPCTNGMAGPFPCHDVDLMTFLPPAGFGGGPGSQYGGPGNDVWGWTDPETGGEWVIMGRSDGTSFIDITDPKDPRFVATLPKHGNNELHSDMKTYQNHAFIVSESSGNGLQVFDLTRLRELEYTGTPVTVTEDAFYGGYGNAHDVVINEDTGYAYAVGTGSTGNVCASGLHMVDIRDPKNPTYAGCYNADGYTHDAQCVIYHGDDERYQGREICFLANPNPRTEGRLTVVDVTDKANPVMLSRTLQGAPYSYSHQGWLTEDHNYFLHDDESDEIREGGRTRTRIFDTSDLENVTVHSVYHGETFASDHNLYVKGEQAYLTNYIDGLRVIDLAGIDTPGPEPAPDTPDTPDATGIHEVACFDTDPSRNDVPMFAGSWSNYPWFEDGIVAVSGFDGLFILKTNLDGSTGGGIDGCILNDFPVTFDPEVSVADGVATVSGVAAFPESTGAESVGGTKAAFSSSARPIAAAAGIELVAAKIEQIDGGLRFIWEVSGLPDPQVGVPPEGVRYAWTLQTDAGAVYQLEAKRSNVASLNALEDPAGHAGNGVQETFRLRGGCTTSYQGAPVSECSPLAALEGSFDHANDRVTIDWPFDTRDAVGNLVAPDFTPAATLSNAIFQGMSISASFQALTTLNNNNLSNSINGWGPYHVGPRVEMVAAPAGSRPTRLTFDTLAQLEDGAFTGQIAVDATNDTIYALACVRAACGYGSVASGLTP